MKPFILTTILSLIGLIGLSQPDKKEGRPTREQIEAEKVAYISRELSLTPLEAEKFWPVYNVYSEKIMTIHKKRRSYHKEMKDTENITEERAYELTKLMFQTHNEESTIRLKYLEEFSSILGKKKAAQFFLTEEQFKRVLLRRLKEQGKRP